MGTFVRRWRMADGGIWDMGYGIWADADGDCVLQTDTLHSKHTDCVLHADGGMWFTSIYK